MQVFLDSEAAYETATMGLSMGLLSAHLLVDDRIIDQVGVGLPHRQYSEGHFDFVPERAFCGRTTIQKGTGERFVSRSQGWESNSHWGRVGIYRMSLVVKACLCQIQGSTRGIAQTAICENGRRENMDSRADNRDPS